MKLKEYEKHILNIVEDRQSLCGEKVWDFAFEDIDHAYFSIIAGGRLHPCPACIKKIRQTFRQLR